MSVLSVLSVAAPLLTVATAQYVASLSVAALPTQGVSQTISPSFAGFGIEPSNLFSFTGGAEPNQLSINLLNNLANYTGTPPHLRIGGNTADDMLYSASQNDYIVEYNPKPVGQGIYPTDEFIIGPRYFEALNRFPKNTPLTVGLNLAYDNSDYIEQIVTMANAAYAGLSNPNLTSFEIGNEPDLYLINGFRTEPWGGAEYTTQWLNRAQALWQQVLQPHGIASNFFEPAATASIINTTFPIDMLVQDGITATAIDSTKPYIACWNQHDYYYFINVSNYTLTMADVTYLPNTYQQFTAWAEQVNEALGSGYAFALREMGMVGPTGMDGITNVFAASLWTLNFFFYAATLNVSSVQMHMTDNGNASAWQPIPDFGNEPYVRPNYYAWAAFDQTIGRSCNARVGSYDVVDPTGVYYGRLGTYAVYDDETLSAIVLINTAVANESTAIKGTLTVDLTLPTSFAGQKLYLSYLTAAGADSKTGTTWNGVSFETSGDGTPTVENPIVQTVPIGADGSAAVVVRDSEALVASVGRAVGSAPLNAAACAAFASHNSKPVASSASSSSRSSTTSLVIASLAATSLAAASSSTASSSSSSSIKSSPVPAAELMVRVFLVLSAVCFAFVFLG